MVAGAQSRADGTIRERLVVFDGAGRRVGQGSRGPIVGAVSVCPGGKRLLEIADGWHHRYLRVRRLDATVTILRSTPLSWPPNGSFYGEIRCSDPAGRRGIVFLSQDARWDETSVLYRVDRGRLMVFRRGRFSEGVLAKRAAYLWGWRDGRRTVTAVDLRTGRERVVARVGGSISPVGSVAVSPDEASVAVVTQRPARRRHDIGGEAPNLHLFDTSTGTRRAVVPMREFPFPINLLDPGFSDAPDPAPPCPPSCASGSPLWLSNDAVAFVPSWWSGHQSDVFSAGGEPAGVLPGFYGHGPIVLGDRLFALSAPLTVENISAPAELQTIALTGGTGEVLVGAAGEHGGGELAVPEP